MFCKTLEDFMDADDLIEKPHSRSGLSKCIFSLVLAGIDWLALTGCSRSTSIGPENRVTLIVCCRVHSNEFREQELIPISHRLRQDDRLDTLNMRDRAINVRIFIISSLAQEVIDQYQWSERKDMLASSHDISSIGWV